MKNNDYLSRSFKAVTSAVAELGKKYSNICLPIRNSFYYDLVFERDFTLFRVKVIFTNCKQTSGSYVANIRNSGGYDKKKEIKSPFNPKFCDYLYVETPESKYLIPSSKISTQRSITLSQFESFRISSEVEQRPVKSLVVGSNPTSGV